MSSRARRCASSCVILCATYSSIFRSRWSRSSSSSSWSACAQRNNDRIRSGIVNSQCFGRILQPPFGAKRSSRLFELNNPRNGARKSAPVVCFFFELSPPQPCQRIVFRPPAILGRFPLRRDPTLLFQLVQSRVKRSVAHLQHIARHLLQPLAHREAVHRFKRQNFQQQHVQRALHEIRRFAYSMSSVTEASTSALGKQGEMLFFLVFQGAKLAVSVPSNVLLSKDSESERQKPL